MPKSAIPASDLLELSRRCVGLALERAASSGARLTALDGTAGNGLDTEFLARGVGPDGLVLAFDVQDEAIAATAARLSKAGLSGRVRLVRASHADLDERLEVGLQIRAAMYNLGFLPRGSSPLTTGPDSTLASLRALQGRMAPGGVISVHCYTGQNQGPEELKAVQAWASALDWELWRVARYEFCNKPSNREVLFLACKL